MNLNAISCQLISENVEEEMAKHDSYSFDITLRIEIRPEGCRWGYALLKERVNHTARIFNKPEKINGLLRRHVKSAVIVANIHDVLGQIFVELGKIITDGLKRNGD